MYEAREEILYLLNLRCLLYLQVQSLRKLTKEDLYECFLCNKKGGTKYKKLSVQVKLDILILLEGSIGSGDVEL